MDRRIKATYYIRNFSDGIYCGMNIGLQFVLLTISPLLWAAEGHAPSQRLWESELSILSFSGSYQTGEALDEVSHHRTYRKQIYYLVEFQHVALQRETCISCMCDIGDVTYRDYAFLWEVATRRGHVQPSPWFSELNSLTFDKTEANMMTAFFIQFHSIFDLKKFIEGAATPRWHITIRKRD